MMRFGICPDEPPERVLDHHERVLGPGDRFWWLHRAYENPAFREGTVERLLWEQGPDAYEPVVCWAGRTLAPCLLYADEATARADFAALLEGRLREAESRGRAYRAQLEAHRAGEGNGDVVVQAVS